MKCLTCNEREESEQYKLNSGREIGVCSYCGALLRGKNRSNHSDPLMEMCESIDYVKDVKRLVKARSK